jgi:hypothetical protein
MDEYMYAIFFAAVAVDVFVRWWRGSRTSSQLPDRQRSGAHARAYGERVVVGEFYE